MAKSTRRQNDQRHRSLVCRNWFHSPHSYLGSLGSVLRLV
jgi:hypothetical protein